MTVTVCVHSYTNRVCLVLRLCTHKPPAKTRETSYHMFHSRSNSHSLLFPIRHCPSRFMHVIYTPPHFSCSRMSCSLFLSNALFSVSPLLCASSSSPRFSPFSPHLISPNHTVPMTLPAGVLDFSAKPSLSQATPGSIISSSSPPISPQRGHSASERDDTPLPAIAPPSVSVSPDTSPIKSRFTLAGESVFTLAGMLYSVCVCLCVSPVYVSVRVCVCMSLCVTCVRCVLVHGANEQLCC